MRYAPTLLLCALLAGGAQAATDDPERVVTVDGIKRPEMRSYRSVLAGFDAFDEYHHFAPAAPALLFRMVARSDAARASTDGLALRIASDSESVPVPIGADGVFSIPSLPAADFGDADLILNRKQGQFHSTPEIRTPGLPANVRRLGDLRLECRVTVAMVKTELSMWIRATINTFLMTGDWCSFKKGTFSFESPTPLLEGTISYNGRSEAINVRRWRYVVPMGDTVGWPDDSLIELRYAPPQE